MAEKRFHKKGFTSFLTAFSFLIMSITGIILYIVPQGRIAYWTDWKILGLTKTDWGNIHLVSVFLFLGAAIYHIYLNWKALMNYLIDRVKKGINMKSELTIAVIVTLFFTLSGLYLIPPLGYLVDLNKYIKKSWVKSKEYEPPFGHAEELSLKVFAKKMKIDLNPAMEELKGKGIVVENEMDSLQKIARRNKTNAMNLYVIMKKFEHKEIETGIVYTPELVEEKFAGTGVGRKTLTQVCEENNIDLNLAKKKLSEKGISTKEGETMKEIASRYDKLPMDILKIILVENYKP